MEPIVNRMFLLAAGDHWLGMDAPAVLPRHFAVPVVHHTGPGLGMWATGACPVKCPGGAWVFTHPTRELADPLLIQRLSLSRRKASATDKPSGAIPWAVPFITWA
jgi:hypothetical protein